MISVSDASWNCSLVVTFFCLLFSESFQNPTFITETQMCHQLCGVCCLLSWTLVSPCPGEYGLFTSPVLSLESVLIKCASWTNFRASFLLISYFLRDFLFQIFSLVFIFTTIFLLLKCSVYLSPNDWISLCQHLRTFRGIENYCYHLNKLLSYTRICHFFIFYFLFYISLLTFLFLIDFFFLDEVN